MLESKGRVREELRLGGSQGEAVRLAAKEVGFMVRTQVFHLLIILSS